MKNCMEKVKIELLKDGDIFHYEGFDEVVAEPYSNGYIFVTNSEIWEKDGVYSYSGGCYKAIPEGTEVERLGNMETLDDTLLFLQEKVKTLDWQLNHSKPEYNLAELRAEKRFIEIRVERIKEHIAKHQMHLRWQKA